MPRRRTKQREETRGRPLNDPDLSSYRGRFGANLRKLRLRRFATIQAFCDALGEHVDAPPMATVARWELGDRIPDLELWPIIADVLNVKPSRLLPAD